jgi:Leucine-rich repeat (LRR) protein
MAECDGRKFEMFYDADADVDFTENSMIADYSVIEEQMEVADGNQSLIQPTLPSGRVIDYKNTMQSYDYPVDSSVATPPTSHVSSNIGARASFSTPSAIKRHSEVSNNVNSTIGANAVSNSFSEDVQAVAIVEGKAFIESPEPQERPNQNRVLWLVIGILVVMIAIVVTGVCSSGKCSTKSDHSINEIPSLSPSLAPSRSPTKTPVDVQIEQAVSAFINNITYLEEEILVNGTTPESRALAWLIRDDELYADNRSKLLNLDSESEVRFRLRQRYPLRTLWYQQFDEDGAFSYNWVEAQGWKDDPDECSWYGINCTLDGLSERNEVTSIDFYSDFAQKSNNYFGTIPPDIGLLTSLLLFDFKSNRLIGTLPDSIGKCSILQVFDISDCLVAGTFPSSIGALTDMAYFDVADNEIFGTIPSKMQDWFNLTYFVTQNNGLIGSLPNFITGWTSLSRLDFYGNEFSGTIPESIGSLTNLTLLDFGFNKLRGTLPFSIGELTNLTYAGFNSNNLVGMIPTSVGNWNLIEFALFAGNDFTGTVPMELCSSDNRTTKNIYVECDLECPVGCCSYFKECSNNLTS